MNSKMDRRQFVQLLGAVSTELGLQVVQTTNAHAEPQAMPLKHAESRAATINRKDVVAIQVKPFCWVDEGIDKVLDTLQEKGNVNTVFVYTYDYDQSRITKGGTKPLPDHGKYSSSSPRTAAHFTTMT
jgi:hypothetical protein